MIALQATAEAPPAMLGCLLHLIAVILAAHKHMDMRCLWSSKDFNLLHRRVDLTLERYIFLYGQQATAVQGGADKVQRCPNMTYNPVNRQ